MDVVLVTITMISLTMACAMGIVTWRLLREERRRADARVAALLADLGRGGGRDDEPVGAPAVGERTAPPRVSGAEVTRSGRRPTPAEPITGSTTAVAAELGRRARQPPSGLFTSFGSQASNTPLRPFLVTVAAAIVILAVVSFTIRARGDISADSLAEGSLPVELLSLTHSKRGDYLEISGAIRNPPDGIERSRLSVAATVFDLTGTAIGSGQTPIRVGLLPPGGETTFSIALPDADLINRYRISFMQDQSTLPHVDRRRPSKQVHSTAQGSAGSQP